MMKSKYHHTKGRKRHKTRRLKRYGVSRGGIRL